jgi:hypothetical protein
MFVCESISVPAFGEHRMETMIGFRPLDSLLRGLIVLAEEPETPFFPRHQMASPNPIVVIQGGMILAVSPGRLYVCRADSFV